MEDLTLWADTEDVAENAAARKGGKGDDNKLAPKVAQNPACEPRPKRIRFERATEAQLLEWAEGNLELWRFDIMEDGEWKTEAMCVRVEVY
ncbi:hypothetical protein [Pseudaminobacter sp. NGMCC 1.201702]|uniref:hypothetical protein n=1 Tax=Pseudaminobacter sp. NGMCC 1.201702 TaxID=3391825 RepID=UPI0039EFFDC3